MSKNNPVGVVVTILQSVPEVWGSIPGPVKSNTVSPTAFHSCDVFSEMFFQLCVAPLLVTRFGVIL